MQIGKRIVKNVLRRAGYTVNKIGSNNSEDRALRDTTVRIGKFPLLINGDHHLPHALQRYPGYALNIARIAKHLTACYPDLCVIDIGANVGDTVALIRSVVDIPIVCIEGDETYYDYLVKNVVQFHNVTTHKYFLGDIEQTLAGDVVSKLGTLYITTEGRKTIQLVTLDRFLQSTQTSGRLKLLKIDTDGYDAKIIRGGLQYVRECKPVIVFEYDRRTQENARENGLDILGTLQSCGYDLILFYDNVGRYVCSSNVRNVGFLNEMHAYISKRKGLITYYDICVFHDSDNLAGRELIASEVLRNEAG
jgi:FkbM family methyltransferase